jgi:hypothetical protein
VQVPRAKMPVRAPETTLASSLGRYSGTLLRSSIPPPSSAGAAASATSIATRFPRVCVAFIFGASSLVWRGREGKERERLARGSPGEEGLTFA